jgi:hypothetical protein
MLNNNYLIKGRYQRSLPFALESFRFEVFFNKNHLEG